MKKKTRKKAVALKYDGQGAPKVIAKGDHEIASKIIEIAEEHGIPLHEDEQLTNLLSQLELGDEIPRELYVAIAEVIAFAYLLRGTQPDFLDDQ